MNVLVAVAISRGRKSLVAVFARKWLFARVNELVVVEPGAGRKRLEAYLALKRQFSRVVSSVIVQIALLHVPLGAIFARVRPLTRVHAHVDNVFVLGDECGTALFAWNRLFAQGCLFARKGLIARVEAHMIVQLTCVAKVSVADSTLEDHRAHMRPHVLAVHQLRVILQPLQWPKRRCALSTLVHHLSIAAWRHVAICV